MKIRGFRIEPGEIEAALCRHAAVRGAAVVARADVPGETWLVAYITSGTGDEPTMSELRRHLRTTLPEYMIPSIFIPLDAFPLTPNGKVDRRALPLPDGVRPGLEEVFVAPRTPVEEVLAGIWAEVLKLDRVGVHDNFFELGGHSLLATQIISRVREAFHVEVPLRTLFDAPTVAGIAGVIQEAKDRGESPAAGIAPVSRQRRAL